MRPATSCWSRCRGGSRKPRAAASWRAREWLGFGCLEEGAEADFVVYDSDPTEDLGVLHRPTCVVLRGRVVA